MNIDIRIDEAKRRSDGLACVEVLVPEIEFATELDISFKVLFHRCRVPNGTALDLLMVASICYAVDKGIRRSSKPDAWTRNFVVEIPVNNPELWTGASSEISSALDFLTGDSWNLTFRHRKETLFVEPIRTKRQKPIPPKLNDVNVVCSLSGGLDSLSGAINLLEANANGIIHFVGHYDASGSRSPQESLFELLATAYPGKSQISHVRIRQIPNRANEMTLRSRSFLFAAILIYAAQAASADTPIHMPENGFIALNLPLTPSRAGSCSTRTMHPYYLAKLQTALAGLGITNPISNMFEMKTKGECLEECTNRDLLGRAEAMSVSCSHGTRQQYWNRRGKAFKNCGYCVPCIIRRAALKKIGLDDGQLYGMDLSRGEVNTTDGKSTGNDLRAISTFLSNDHSHAAVVKEIIAVASVSRVKERADMILRGIDEMKVLFATAAVPKQI